MDKSIQTGWRKGRGQPEALRHFEVVRGADLLSSSSLRLAMPRGLGRGTAAGKPPREKPPPGHVFHGHCSCSLRSLRQ